ncbi:MAG: aspartate aminotransferase family protein [Acidobacteriaceae bacterium]|nr:aspartate aminotransferase family protein [Acidobacteriaceae bacterium]
MKPAEFLRAADEHCRWIAEYFEHVRDLPVLPDIQPGELRNQMPSLAPEEGEPIEQIFADFRSVIGPALTLWNHPRFLAYFSISSTPPSILAELLIATLNVNAMLWKTSPAATELEEVTLGWIRQWLGLPDEYFGIIYDTASVGVLQALDAARLWICPECRSEGMRPGLTVYISEHTHSSSERAAIMLGFGQKNVRIIGVDAEFRMRADLLEDAIRRDLSDGKTPCCIVASIGSTSASAIDPVPAIADIADRYGIWLHVDAAYGGSAAIVPEMRHVLAGAERAHSFLLNPHKWLYVSIDCSVLYIRHPEVLRRAASLTPEYLRTKQDSDVVNYSEYGVQLGRRFRALKLWYVLRYYGRQGIIAMLRESIRLAQLFKSFVQADEDFELSAPVPFALVCFRHRSDDDFNRCLLEAVNASGKAFLSHTVLHGRFVLRCSIGNFQTNEADIRDVWELIRASAARLENEFAAQRQDGRGCAPVDGTETRQPFGRGA